MNSELTPRESDLYGIMQEAGVNVDVPIVDLYDSLFTTKTHDFALKQQRVGAIISRMNRFKLDGVRIQPGRIKRTYRLVTLTN